MPEDDVTTVGPETDSATEPDLVEEESLVEEVSIDGMCGVY
jgi:mycofactocin precursor